VGLATNDYALTVTVDTGTGTALTLRLINPGDER
jgi:hypothetical protein